MMPDRKRLASIVRVVLVAARKDRDLNQTELAQRLEMTRNQVANIESGRRAVDIVDFVLIAKGLNIDPIALLHRILRW